jgi:1,4-alpha-glucan branching enzyme
VYALLLLMNLARHSPPIHIAAGDQVIYEVNLRAVGGFRQIESRLDALKRVGTTIVWLMPIHPVGQVRSAGGLGSPYAVRDYDSVNPEFGTLDDFRHLVRAIHRRKMRVILDWVGNHTSWDNPWLAHRDWYTQNEHSDIQIPAGTNWNDAADLNYSCQPMRTAMVTSMRRWIRDEGADGFRCDFADGIPIDFWSAAIPELRASVRRPLFFLAEGTREANVTAGFDLNNGWKPYGSLLAIYYGKRPATDFDPRATFLRFTSNHDESAWHDSDIRIFGGKEAAFGAFVANAFSAGATLIYNGQEIGWEAKIPFFTKSNLDWNSDPEYRKRFERLMAFRARSHAALRGSIEVQSQGRVIAFTKSLDRNEVFILVNTSATSQAFPVPTGLQGKWQIPLSPALIDLAESLELTPQQSMVLERHASPKP